MKIGMILDNYSINGSGTETAATTLANELKSADHEVYFIVKNLQFTEQKPELLADDHILVYSKVDHNNKQINGIFSKKELALKLKELKLDLLHAHDYDYKIARYLKKQLHIKLVHTCHYCRFIWKLDLNPKFINLKLAKKSENEAKINKMIKRQFLWHDIEMKRSRNIYDLGISISHFTDLYYPLMIDKARIRNIPNPLDFKKFNNPDTSEVENLKKKFKLKDTDIVLLHHSRFCKEKKTFELIRDFAHLKNDNIKLLLIGYFQDQKYELKVKELIKEYNIQNRVIFPGIVAPDQLKNYFALADIGVYYSYSDSFWLAYLEFLATGKPIVINQIDAIVGVIEDGKNGLIANNTDEFVTAVNRLINDKELYQYIASNTRPSIERFSINNYLDKMLAFYNEALSL